MKGDFEPAGESCVIGEVVELAVSAGRGMLVSTGRLTVGNRESCREDDDLARDGLTASDGRGIKCLPPI